MTEMKGEVYMCMKVPTCNEVMKWFERPCYATKRRFGVPLVKGATPEDSLVVYTSTNEFRVNRRGTAIIDRNPLESVICPGMLESMELGLSDSATVQWVRFMANYCEAEQMPSNDVETEKAEVGKELMAEMIRTQWNFTAMRAVEIALPHRSQSTHWLICQPLAGATELCWDALQRDALGIWKTAENVYFVLPVGYRNVIRNLADEADEYPDDAAFFEANATKFREVCQQMLDAPVDAERARSKNLPWLREAAQELVQQFALVTGELAVLQSEGIVAELHLDADQENLVYGQEVTRLTEEALQKFEVLLPELLERVKVLQKEAEAVKVQSQRAEGFREVLRDAKAKITIRDTYGVLTQAITPKRFGKTVEVDLLQDEAVITILKNGEKRQETRYGYTEVGGADRFNRELERLGVTQHDEDEPYQMSPKTGLKDMLFGHMAKA